MDSENNKKVYERKHVVEEKKAKTVLRLIASIIIFTILAEVACFLRNSIPLMPSFVTIEFSVFFEFLAGIAYGPIVGIVVCFLKAVINAAFVNTAAITDVTNFFIESAFVGIAGVYYSERAILKISDYQEDEARKNRRRRIFFGGLLGSIPAMIIQYFLTGEFTIPMLEKYYGSYGYTKEALLFSYQRSAEEIALRLPAFLADKIPAITDMNRGILVLNLPITFAKLVLVTVVTMIIYPYISPFLHFMRKDKK